MILVVDAGNSNIVAGLYRGEELCAHWRLSTRPYRTSDEQFVTLRELFREADVSPRDVLSVALSSVVPPITEGLRRALERLCGVTPFQLSSHSVPWLNIATENRHEMGPDLIANAVAGGSIGEGYVSIIDFGTALTITTVNPEKTVLGVSIAPGLGTANEALSSGTAQLPQVSLEAPDAPFGTNTVSAIQAGLVHGYSAMIEGMIERLDRYFATSITAVATGGLCSVVAPLVSRISTIDPWLTLRGLRIIAERNQDS